MRELKFRMWDQASKKYRALDSIAFDKDTGLVKVANGWGQNIIEDKDVICHREPPMFVMEQFTGLKDKNGVEIYEGDIVNAWIDYGPGGEGKHIFQVSIHPHGCSIEAWNFKEEGFLPEVIGNIHENPELLDPKP